MSQEHREPVEERRAGEGQPKEPKPAQKAPERKPARPVHPSGESHQLVSETLEEIGSLGVPKRAMHEAVRTSDDEVRKRERARTQEASIEFRPDPELGDAAADLADDLGRHMLDSATSGVDMSELVPPEESFEEEVGGPYIVSGFQVGEEEEEEFALSDIDEKTRRRPGK